MLFKGIVRVFFFVFFKLGFFEVTSVSINGFQHTLSLERPTEVVKCVYVRYV